MYWGGPRNVITNLLTFSMAYVSNILSFATRGRKIKMWTSSLETFWFTRQIYKKLTNIQGKERHHDRGMDGSSKVWSRVKRTFSLGDKKSFSEEAAQELFLEV